MGVVTLPPSDVAAVVESATIPTVTFAVPPPTAVAVPPPPTVFPVATAAAGSLTASVQAYHPSIHCCPMAVSTMSMISVHAAKVPISHRPPLHITAVVDTSGSMNSDNKLTAVKAALRFVVASLSDEDLFSVVTFDENAKTVVGLTPVTGHANGRVQQQINAMTAQGRTNLSAGVQMAVGLMHGSRPTPVYPTPLRTAHHVPPPPLPAYMSHIPAHVAPPPMPAHLMHMASRKIPATVAPAVVPTTVPPFYVGITRVNAADNALLKIEATLPAYVSHIDVTAPGQIGSLQWKNGSPAMAVWPTGPLTFAIAFAQLNFAPLSQTVELESGVATFLTIAPQMTAAPGPEVTSARVVRPVPMAKPKLPIQLMMLFTDGEANLGISDVNTLSRKCTEWMRASCPDATLIAFGFGASHNAKLLRQVATATQGTYYHVPTAADIPKLFGDCLGGFMSVAARKLVVTVQPANPFVTINGVQTTYQATYDATGTIKVALKDLFSEERRDMIVSLTVHPTALALNDSMPLFKVTVTSLDAVGAPMEPIAITAATPVIATPYTGLPNTEVEEQIGRMAAAVAVEKATDLASLGNFEEARHVLTHARAKQVTTRSAYARCVDEDLKAMEFNLNASAWAREGCVAANAMQTQHAQQRCNVPTAASASYYQTAAKAAFGSKASAFAGY